MSTQIRVCKTCRITKNIGQFNIRSGYYQLNCKTCHLVKGREYSKRYYDRNTDDILQRRKDIRDMEPVTKKKIKMPQTLYNKFVETDFFKDNQSQIS